VAAAEAGAAAMAGDADPSMIDLDTSVVVVLLTRKSGVPRF